MFRLRNSHTQSFASVDDENLIKELAIRLRYDHSGCVIRLQQRTLRLSDLSNSLLCNLIRSGLEKASCYGLGTLRSRQQFLEMMFLYAPNFDQHPDIAAVLKSKVILRNWKLEVLKMRWKPESRIWREIADAYDECAW